MLTPLSISNCSLIEMIYYPFLSLHNTRAHIMKIKRYIFFLSCLIYQEVATVFHVKNFQKKTFAIKMEIFLYYFFCEKVISDYFGMICFSLGYRYGKSRSGEKIANSVQLRIRKILNILVCSDSFFVVVN